MLNNQPKFKNVWLVNDTDKAKFYKLTSRYSTSKKYKVVKKKSIKGFYYFCKSKNIFHTHGIFNNVTLSKNQVNVNLWHGMPLKNIGHLDGNKSVPTSNYSIATSPLFQKIMAQAFSLSPEKVLVSGQPRNDLLFDDKYNLLDLLDQDINNFSHTILWMPTYRKSKVGDIRIDGELKKFNDFLDETYLKDLNDYLNSINAVCVVKLHPMDYMDVNHFKNYSNLFFINNDNFEQKGISLYSVLKRTDLLLTDFSSIYIDYLLLDKPMAFLVSDFKQYSNSRGFVFEKPVEFMPGKMIDETIALIPFLEDVLINKIDEFSSERKKVNNVFHEIKSDFSEKIFQQIFHKNV